MKLFKKIFLAIIILPCAFLCSACLNSEPNIYLVDVVFGTNDDNEKICTYIYSNGYSKEEVISELEAVKTVVDITKLGTSGNVYLIKYSDNTTSQISLSSEDTNAIVEFKQKTGIDNVYVLTYADGTTSDITLESDSIDSIVGIKKSTEKDNEYIITYSTGKIETLTMGTLNNTITIEDVYESKVVETYNKVIDAGVNIIASQSSGGSSTGSGVIYHMDKNAGGKTYIITNHHVIADKALSKGISNNIQIYQYGTGETTITAEYVGSSKANDVGVLRVETSQLLNYNPNSYAPIASNTINWGDTAIAVGNPFSQGFTITTGRVSLPCKFIAVEGSLSPRRVFGLDTPINSGNSGGGIFNLAGELIGLADAKMIELVDELDSPATTNNPEAMGYALPIDLVKSVADNIIYNYERSNISTNPKTIDLGIVVTGENQRPIKDDNGMTREVEDIIITVATGSIAENNLKLATNDILLEFIITRGTQDIVYALTQDYKFDENLLDIRIGDKIKFKYSRSGVEKSSSIYTITSSDLSKTVT